MIDNEETGRRLAAARALAGYDSRAAFAAALALPGFGEGTVKAVERGKREFRRHERAEVARFCGLPAGFFEIERALLGANGEEPFGASARRTLATARQLYEEHLQPQDGATQPAAAERLADDALDEIARPSAPARPARGRARQSG